MTRRFQKSGEWSTVRSAEFQDFVNPSISSISCAYAKFKKVREALEAAVDIGGLAAGAADLGVASQVPAGRQARPGQTSDRGQGPRRARGPPLDHHRGNGRHRRGPAKIGILIKFVVFRAAFDESFSEFRHVSNFISLFSNRSPNRILNTIF